jgi:phosphonatase-like hydrolase
MSAELIVFDLAGTTVKDNKDVHRVLQTALEAFGVNVSLQDANAEMGFPKPVAIRSLLEKRYQGNRAITPEWIADIHTLFVKEMIAFYQTDPSVGEKEGVSRTFKILKERNMKIMVDTGFDRQIADPLIARLGWQEQKLIDGSVTSDEVLRGRPFPDLIYKAMELTNTRDPRHVAKVGDTASDLREGSSAGCGWVIGVTTGAFTRTELLLEEHTHLVENVEEILEIL